MSRIVIEQWRWEYNSQRPHSSLGYRTPAEVGAETRATMAQQSHHEKIVVPAASVEAAFKPTGLVEPVNTGEILS